MMTMQSVMILMVATGVSVCQDSREMDTTVLVSMLKNTKDKILFIGEKFQTLTNVIMLRVMRMQNVSTLKEVLAVSADQDSLEMDTTVLVCLESTSRWL